MIFQKKKCLRNFRNKSQSVDQNLTKIELKLFIMPDSRIKELLKRSFPESNKQDWLRVAALEIQGKDPAVILSWENKDGLAFLPYYDHTDGKNLAYLKNFELSPSSDPYSGSRAWKNLPRVSVIDVEKSNLVARDHLANGADGIFFDLGILNVVDISRLLNKIDWPFCNVTFLAGSSAKLAQFIFAYIEKQKYDPALITGTIFWQSVPTDASAALQEFSSVPDFHALGIFVNSSSPVKEIAEALVKAVQLMDLLTGQGLSKEFIWRNINISLPSGIDFLLEIAKLKALRLLWYQVALAFEIDSYKTSDLKMHVRSIPWTQESFQPHGNLHKSTTSALSAILGGCDTLTVEPEDEFNPTMNRVARNVSSIIREESQLDMVADPTAGSYVIDSMVDKIAQAAWSQFQSETKAR